MNKKLIYAIISIIFVLSIIAGGYMYSSSKDNTSYETQKLATEEILDECTDEYEYMKKEDLEQSNST